MPPRKHDVDRLKDLLLWARTKGFAVGPIVEIGEVKLQVRDIRQEAIDGKRREDPHDPGPYGDHADDEPAEGTIG